MTAESDVIRLVHRADWTRLNLAAEVNDGSKVVVAPGRRYREQTADGVRGCNGERPWRLAEPGEDVSGHWIEGPEPPLPVLLCPAWILRSSRLEVLGHVSACGRDALHVVASERPGIGDRMGPVPHRRPGRTEALVDSELGILLRVAWLAAAGESFEDEPPDVTEIVSLELDPATDPAQFAPPSDSIVAESWADSLRSAGPVFAAAKTAAGLAAGGLGALIRHWPFDRPSAAPDPRDAYPAMPQDDPAPEMSPDGRLAGAEVSDEVLHLLHDSGTAAFDATLHQWNDFAVMLAQVPEAVRRTGFGGLGMLISALIERGASAVHMESALRIGGPGRYQIDHRYEIEVKDSPKTIACDGRRRWRVYDDWMTVGPAQPPPSDIADLADTSWLLECSLSGGMLVMAGDRPAYHIDLARRGMPRSALMLFPAAVAVVDAELGILLSLTSFLRGTPVRRYELRDVTVSRAGDFQVDIPSGLRVEPESNPLMDVRDADPTRPVPIPLKVAGAVAREVGKEAARAARNFLRRLNP